MRITSKGQVTIPQHIREKLGLLPNTEVEFEIDRDTCVHDTLSLAREMIEQGLIVPT